MDYSHQFRSSLHKSYPMFFNELGHSENQVNPVVQLSEKAKAFTIDAILNTGPKDKKPTHHVSNVVQTSNGRDFRRRELFTKNMTPNMSIKQEEKESYVSNHQSNTSAYHLQYHTDMNTSQDDIEMAVQKAMYYSPLMTCGYRRPEEGFSPMPNEGQQTPLGLKSVYPQHFDRSMELNCSMFSTPDSKNMSMSSEKGIVTPHNQSNFSRLGGRKVMSTYTRRHDRPHPYMSVTHRQNISSPCQELELLIQNTAEETGEHPTTKTGKAKRFRTAFTPEQLQVLEEEFDKQQYCVGNERVELAESLNLNVSQVKVWFQNRRIKWRKEQFEQGKIN